ncbi:TraX family protein [Pseudomonas sp. RAC1]|uniref:TraX family protein n=1 Tax=Pseudomonas sp. RAC1 TaxID=3064900 RepID=UPI00271ACC99|nr:TraX family protein [Pseudomonas sp. RAC1]MDV9031887.1 TraX family protein [Pseudomonas sp. RAC1]
MDGTGDGACGSVRGVSLNGRSAGLDLAKWVAILSMVADHLRYLWPEAVDLFVIGRLAFPLFCLVIACHVMRVPSGQLYRSTHARYLVWMLAFCVLSEPPYRWLDTGTTTFSVMPTLTLGLLCAWGVHHPQRLARLAAVSAVLVAWLLRDRLMYGLPGVLLPAGCLLLWNGLRVGLMLPMVLAIAGNMTNSWLASHLAQPFTWMVMASAALAIPLGWRMLACNRWRISPVGRWAYGFYPLHLLVIKAVLIMRVSGTG